MAAYIASYDLRSTADNAHWTFLERAVSRNWSPWIQAAAGQKWHQLPNTTLIGDFPTRDAAVAALKAALADTVKEVGPVTMPKWIVADRGGSTFSSDEKQDA